MATLVIGDFKYGIDRRRPRVAGIPGTLWLGKNCHITRGGDVEGMKKWVPVYELPDGTFGLGQVRGQLFVFGSDDLASSIPNGLQYQRLQLSSANMTRVLWNNTFDGKHYVVADFDDGNIAAFYDGTRISAWDTIADAAASYETLADYLSRKLNADSAVRTISYGNTILITAQEPGTAFTLATDATDVGGTDDQTATVTAVQANVAAVAEVRATGTVQITGGTRDPGINKVSQLSVNGVSLITDAVDWLTSNATTAAALAAKINNSTQDHGYIASAVGATVTITAAVGTGTTPNGYVVSSTLGGDVTASLANMAGGVAAVAAVAQISKIEFGGTFEATDKFTITLNAVDYVATGRASAMATSAFTYKGREYTPAGSLYRFCKLDDPTDLTDASASTGAGFINASNDSEGTERLLVSVPYQQSVAVFARKSIRLYNIFADNTANVLVQLLENTGTVAPRSVVPAPNSDVYFLDEPGVRLIRIHDTNGNIFMDDAGTQIDPLVIDWIRSLPESVVEQAVSTVEPIDGRINIAIGGRIFVLSYFRSAKINAWSYYEPGFTVTDFARVNKQLWARDTGTEADKIFLYGGFSGEEYPGEGEDTTVVDTPFAMANTPNFKEWESFDMACSGVWDVDLLVNASDESKRINIGKVKGTTNELGQIAALQDSTLVAFHAECESAGKRTISSFTLRFTQEEES